MIQRRKRSKHVRPPTVGVFAKLRTHRLVVVGASLLAVVVIIAIFASQVAPYPPNEMNFGRALSGPGPGNLLGADHLGRDMLSRIIFGARISLIVGISSVVLALTIGVPLGLIAGFSGGALDATIMRIVDVFLAFPVILLAIAVLSILGPSIISVIVAIGLVTWTQYARVVRGVVLGLREFEFIAAAKSLGASPARIMFRHLLVNTLPSVIVIGTYGMAEAILVEASLSFLGLGVQPPTASWGGILSEGRGYLRQASHIAALPGVAIMFVILGLNFLGDGLRDATDPRSRR